MELWNALEDAVEQRNWATATKLAQRYAREWPVVRDLVLLFADEGAEIRAKDIDNTLASLVAGLEGQSVDAKVVEEEMARARVLVRPDTSA